MQTRHRVPTIFNVYMVDVLCCALGCVILLWLVKSYYAEQEASAADKTQTELKSTSDILKEKENLLREYQEKYNEYLKKYRVTKDSLALKQEDLEKLEKLRNELENLGANLTAKNKDLTKNLGKASLEITDLKKLLEGKKQLLVVLGNKVEDLEKKVKDKNDKLLAATIAGKDLSDKLVNSEKVVADLEKLIAALKKDFAGKLDDKTISLAEMEKEIEKEIKAKEALSGELKEKKKDLAQLTRELTELLKKHKTLQLQLALNEVDLKNAEKVIANLKVDKSDLIEKATYLRLAVDNRFAGVSLTGKKVIFMVDVSRSMRMSDESTDDPDKWPWVCDTIGKVLRSLPNVTHFQVIAFSENVSYPMGNVRQWIPYDPKTSADGMTAALKKIAPVGGTKMTPAFSEAFLFKKSGLDTIYLISDGLPNDDDNLPEEAKKLEGVARTTYLTNRVRTWLKTYWNPPENGKVPVRINAIGFFFESPEVGAFLWALARENDGSFVGMNRKEVKK